jgi:outer membrane immunogenic protein
MFKAGTAIAAVLLFAVAGFAQEDGHFDASLNGAGVIGKQTSGHGIILDSTNSGAALATFRVRFNAKHSLVANYGVTHDSQLYTLGAHITRIQSKVTELSAGYVYNPIQIGKFEPFLLGGLGALSFVPGNTYIDTFQVPVASVKQTQMMFLYGAGVDYRVRSHIAVRLQYRGLIYKTPDFQNPSLFVGGLGHMAEPSIGIVFRF